MPGGLGFALQPQAYLVQKGLWIFAKSESAFWIETDVGTASAYEDAYGLFSSRDLAVLAAAPFGYRCDLQEDGPMERDWSRD